MRKRTAAPWPEHLLGTREQWEKRQAQWREVNEWDRRQRSTTTFEERLAWVNSVFEFVARVNPRGLESRRPLAEVVEGVRRMHEGLRHLGARR